MTLNQKIKEYTTNLSRQGLLRTRSISNRKNGFVYFDSNDYLSLTQDKRIMSAYAKAYQQHPSGSGASMLLSGYHPNHQALERAFAELLQVDSCILCSSGYVANLAVTALLGRLQSSCIIDKAVHASIYDGLALSQTAYTRYSHNNLDDLAKKINTNPLCSVVITEGIFSMSGQKAPLGKISALCRPHEMPLIVDEAHSFGVTGRQGAGLVSLHGLSQKEVPLRIIPLGKACAGHGAIIAGQGGWVEAILQAGRSLIYSTSVSPALSAGLLYTLSIVMESEDRRARLNELIAAFKEQTNKSDLDWADSDTAIQQLRLACPHRALYYAQALKERGFFCSAIRAPTVTLKATGLRIILNYQHTSEQIKQLFTHLRSIDESAHY